MAGSLKPNSDLIEMNNYVLGTIQTYQGTIGALVNGVVGFYNDGQGIYMYSDGDYFEITFNKSCNLWIQTTNGHYASSYSSTLEVYRWDGINYTYNDSITKSQTLMNTTPAAWTLVFANLPSGKYKFVQNRNKMRSGHDGIMISELFFEVDVSYKTLIQDGLKLKYINNGTLTTIHEDYTQLSNTQIESMINTFGMIGALNLNHLTFENLKIQLIIGKV